MQKNEEDIGKISKNMSNCRQPDYGLDDRGVEVTYPIGAGDISLLHNVLTGS
jgi:hypothetical protein